MLVDSFGRSINYLRISLTDRCNLRCVYCMPPDGLEWTPQGEVLSNAEIVHVVQAAAALGMKKIRLTGGEPLVRPGIVELVSQIAAVPGIEDIGLTTNGVLLEKLAGPLAMAGLRRVNISLDTLKPERFQKITRFGSFDRAWKGILAAQQAGLAPIKLNAVVIRGLNDDELLDLARLSLSHPWHIRFIELMPIGNTQDWGDDFPASSDRYVSVQEMHSRLDILKLGPTHAPLGSGPARTFRAPDAPGTVGFISPLGEHFCQSCNRLRLTADGKIRACLAEVGEVSVREALRSGQPVEEFLLRAIASKPAHHNMTPALSAQVGLGMSQVGG